MTDSELISKIASIEGLEMVGDKPSPMFGALIKTARGEDFWHPLANGDIVMRLMLKYDVCVTLGFKNIIAYCFYRGNTVKVTEPYTVDHFLPSCRAVVKCIVQNHENRKEI